MLHVHIYCQFDQPVRTWELATQMLLGRPPEGKLRLLSYEILAMSCCFIVPGTSAPLHPSKYPNWFVISGFVCCLQLKQMPIRPQWLAWFWLMQFLSFSLLVLVGAVFERLNSLSYHLKALVLGTVLSFGSWIWGGRCWQRQLAASFSWWSRSLKGRSWRLLIIVTSQLLLETLSCDLGQVQAITNCSVVYSVHFEQISNGA